MPAPAEVAKTPGTPGYMMMDLEWEVDLEGGETVALKGTVQEAVAQLKVLQPGYDLQVSPPPHVREPRLGPPQAMGAGELLLPGPLGSREREARLGGYRVPRPHRRKAPPRPRPRLLLTRQLFVGRGHLLVQRCRFSPLSLLMPAVLTRKKTKNQSNRDLDSFRDIAAGARVIHLRCLIVKDNGNGREDWASGQVFYKEKWNVIVRDDDCW